MFASIIEKLSSGGKPPLILSDGGPIGPKLRRSCPPGDGALALRVVAVRHLVPRSQGEMPWNSLGKDLSLKSLPAASQRLVKLNERQTLVELGLHQVEFR
jgi:hypothetical protein